MRIFMGVILGMGLAAAHGEVRVREARVLSRDDAVRLIGFALAVYLLLVPAVAMRRSPTVCTTGTATRTGRKKPAAISTRKNKRI